MLVQDLTVEQHKEIHDYYIVAIQVLTQKCQYFLEEAPQMDKVVKFLAQCAKIQKEKIESLEKESDGKSETD